MVLVIARPLQPLRGFKPRITHPRMSGAESAHFTPDVLRHRLAKVVSHPARNIEKNRDIVTRTRRRIQRLAHTLHAALAVRNRAFGLAPASAGRQDDTGKLGGVRQALVLRTES